MTAELSTLRSLKERLEKAEEADRELDGDIWREIVGFDPDRMLPRAWPDIGSPPSPFPPYTASLDASLSLVREVLPGWIWKVCSCHVSDDAWLVPDFNDPAHAARLKKQFPHVEFGGPLDVGFDIDQRPPGRPAIAVLRAMIDALIFIAENTPSPSTVSEE